MWALNINNKDFIVIQKVNDFFLFKTHTAMKNVIKNNSINKT